VLQWVARSWARWRVAFCVPRLLVLLSASRMASLPAVGGCTTGRIVVVGLPSCSITPGPCPPLRPVSSCWASRGFASGYEPSLSERQNRMVHRDGFVLRRGFAVTIGTVINGAAGRDGVLTERRRKLVTDHEDVHVWQQRLFGPLYPIAYISWFVGGVVVSLVRRAVSRNDRPLSTEIDRYAYYRNPFEWHAYTCDTNWPPHGVEPESVWAARFPTSEWIPGALRGSARNPEAPR
jgi:hypothetical protein